MFEKRIAHKTYMWTPHNEKQTRSTQGPRILHLSTINKSAMSFFHHTYKLLLCIRLLLKSSSLKEIVKEGVFLQTFLPRP